MSKKGVDRYKRLLEKVQAMDLGGRGYWRPSQGRSTVRVLPAVGEMEFFFKETGTHRIDNTNHPCPALSSDGQLPCPCCEVNDILYNSGEKDAAAAFRARRRFWMNVVVRGAEDAGPKIFTPGITIFNALVALIGDPDYADITDIDDGTDVSIDRSGEGLNTDYHVVAKRSPSTLGTDDQIEEWLEAAKDLEQLVMGRLLSYEEMAKKTGASVYLDLDDDDFEDEEEDNESEPASKVIERRIERRGRRGGAGRRSRR